MGLKSYIREAGRRRRKQARGDTGEALVLLYHRVIDVRFQPQWLCVPPDKFAAQLAIIKDRYHPLSLTELLDCLEKGRLPRQAVVLTFDDGYADNLLEAKPLLERFEIPATVFVATGKLDQPSEFWWDELEGILFGANSLPNELSLTIDGRNHSWLLPDLLQTVGSRREEAPTPDPSTPDPQPSTSDPRPTTPDPSHLTPHTSHLRSEPPHVGCYSGSDAWNVGATSDPTPRHRLYRLLSPLLRDIPAAEQDDVLGRLADWACVARQNRPIHRTLRPDEVRTLATGGLVEIGAHTVTHPVLARQSRQAQEAEISGSKRRLGEILGSPVSTFSYPFGGRHDYNRQSVSLAKAAGFRGACSNFPAQVWRDEDPFQLPRFLVRDWSATEFGQYLETWFRG